MNFYLAPMEGVTRYIYRNAFNKYFGGVDKYFSPFLCGNQNGNYKHREINDILPENNKDITLVPQILTNKAEDFIEISKKLKDLGYNEVNLNLGCPSGTVTSKKKGSGFLAYPDELNEFLAKIFEANITKISIKTRLGKEDPEEFYQLIDIYNQFNMEELIIHPRVQKDFYKNKPNLLMFKEAVEKSSNPVCYNGDICTVEDYNNIVKQFPMIERIMIGRGLITNPELVLVILGQDKMNRQVWKDFHDTIYHNYMELLSGDKNTLFKMKELWFYLGKSFSNSEKIIKKINKAQRFSEYENAVQMLFQE